MWQKSYDGSPSLYLIATPIGNLDDITKRSIGTLEMVDVVFSEDTRVTGMLLDHLGIKKKLIALYDHNEDTIKEKVLQYLQDGKNVALVTDRGTPVISDPGYKTVKYVADNNYNVIALPGPCAFIPALITSGLAPQPFMFYGFLNSKDSKRKKELEDLVDLKWSMIFYEAPHRIISTLELMLEVLGDRNICVAREITKKFESIYRGKISDLIKSNEELKGEFVIVVEGSNDTFNYNDLSIIDHVDMYVNGKTKMDIMSAIKRVAKDRNVSKNVIYKEYHLWRKK